MRYLLVILMALIVSSCQQSKPVDKPVEKSGFVLPVPPNWTTESFPVPPSFATEITFQGIEDIRFAPGWSKPGSDDYWTYVFVWKLEGNPAIDKLIVSDYLKMYYTGLIRANGQGKGIPLSKLGEAEIVMEDGIDSIAGQYRGSIHMLDYLTQSPIILHFLIRVESCPDQKQMHLFHQLSPQPYSHPVWREMDALWSGFYCENN